VLAFTLFGSAIYLQFKDTPCGEVLASVHLGRWRVFGFSWNGESGGE